MALDRCGLRGPGSALPFDFTNPIFVTPWVPRRTAPSPRTRELPRAIASRKSINSITKLPVDRGGCGARSCLIFSDAMSTPKKPVAVGPNVAPPR